MNTGVVTAQAEYVAAPAGESRASALACRALDLVGAALLLVLLSPLFAALGLAVALDSPGPVIFRQRRVGRAGRPFTVNKFRTMQSEASHDVHRAYVTQLIASDAADEAEEDETLFKLSADSRVTRVGRFLRRSSLDELPQLWNVLLGHMSLVGPRPTIPYEVEQYPPSWFARFAVRPGMTGLWQVSGRSRLTYEQMVQLDIEYARTRTFWSNVRILARTVPTVLFAKDAA